MKAKVGDWILYETGPTFAVSVVRYIWPANYYPWGEEYQTDTHRVHENSVKEVRPAPDSPP